MDVFLKELKEAEEVEHMHRKRIFSDFDERFSGYFEETHAQFTHVLECVKSGTKSQLSAQEKELRDFVRSHWRNIDKTAFFSLPRVTTTTNVLKAYFAEFARMPLSRSDYQGRLLAALKSTLRHREVVPARPNSLFPAEDDETPAGEKPQELLSFAENVLFDEGCYSGFLNEQNRRVGEGVFRTKFGEKYAGTWQNDLPHGYGKKVYSDGNTYTGGWKAGKREGCGKCEFPGGLTFIGEWREDRCLSRLNIFSYSYKGFTCSYLAFSVLCYILICLLLKPPVCDGMQFHTYRDGLYSGGVDAYSFRSGRGVFARDTGELYSGDWVADKMQGEGFLRSQAGDIRIGKFHNNQFLSGWKLQTHPNGDYTVTEVKPSGESVLTILTAAGDLQHGVWNSTHLQGLKLAPNRTIAVGTFHGETLLDGTVVEELREAVYVGGFGREGRKGYGCDVAGEKVFCGLWEKNRKSGTGVYYDSDGSVYFGNWTNDEREGQGMELAPGGSFFTGTFSHGKLIRGKSLRVTKALELSYYGEIADFVANGRGVALREDGSLYTGQWANDVMAGNGVEVKANWSFAIGVFAENQFVEGTAYVSRQAGDIYFGHLERQSYSGHGIHIWNVNATGDSSPSAYVGDWALGKMTGAGLMLDLGNIVKSGNFERGLFENGILLDGSDQNQIYFGVYAGSKRNGPGVSITSNSTVFVGNWANNFQEGSGFQVSLSGDYYSGYFQSGTLSQGTALMNLTSGDIYFGERLKGRNHGHGILLAKDRMVGGAITAYVGQWLNGKMHGSGVQMRLGSIIQRGQFSMGKFMAGSIFRISENAGIYYGAMNNSLRHGKGIFVYNNDTVYAGQWENDYQEGQGLLISALGDYCHGTFQKNYLLDGVALMILPKGEIYFGRRVLGKYEGHGVYLWSDKPSTSIYMGEWQNGRAHGAGILIGIGSAVKRGNFSAGRFTSGLSYTTIEGVGIYYGDIVNTNRHGFGTFISMNRTIYSGLWESDVKKGQGLLVEADGDFYAGEFAGDALLNGSALITLPSRDIYFGGILDGQFHGSGTYVWRDSGRPTQTFTGLWTSGTPDIAGITLRLESPTGDKKLENADQQPTFWRGGGPSSYADDAVASLSKGEGMGGSATSPKS